MKRLYKSRKYKVIDGVCGGIAEYFDIDPVIIRLLFVISIAVGGTGVIAYIIGMIIIPHAPRAEDGVAAEKEREQEETSPPRASPAARTEDRDTSPAPRRDDRQTAGLIFGILLLMIGGIFLLREFAFFSGPFYWIRNHLWDILIPSILILLGLNLILRRR